ncbi:MAG: bifunctional phosphoglucose/phosphomannose isomerase [Candidatus Thermoplasmatota archaeon]|nr:bifunctional phosphoglucose/phosphomannose isomerase [Candidatus Thermoplasmatota archaeon]
MKIEDDTLNFTRMFRKEKEPKSTESSGRIIVAGMGGSGISGDIASVMCNSPQVASWKNYGLPPWANSRDCVICVSYSGNTAETLSVANKAIELGCKLEVITTGGKLEKLASENNCSIIKVEKGHQPRAALPLLLTPLLYKLGIPDLDSQIEEVRKLPIREQRAQEIAEKLKGKVPCIYANGVMMPVAYRWRCQIEENAKQLAFHHEIPEMNHNEIVGWENSPEDFAVVLIRDSQEEEIIGKRLDATKKVAWESKGESNFEMVEIIAEGKSLLARMMSCVLLGDLISLRLAEMNGVEATPVTVIENLKTVLDGK